MDSKPSVLVVDDQPINIRLAAKILNDEFEVLAATSGKAALEIAKSNPVDLILLDVMMPEMDGYEVCARLKEDPDTAAVPVIFLTAKSEPGDVVNGFAIGAVDYVSKPFNPRELVLRVRTHVELERCRAELQQLNATKDRFFSIIAHDLRNPFTVLLGFSQLLLDEYDTYSDAERKEALGRIKATSERSRELVENLLTWSRSQTGRLRCRPQSLALSDLAKKSIALAQSSADAKGIAITARIDPDARAICDPNMLETILRNLLTNAIKFTHPGGSVAILARQNGTGVNLVVEDSGVGMAPETAKQMFRLDTHHVTPGTEGEAGTGLGLILCREFAERNQGAIRVESALGKGSRFIVSLRRPAAPSD